MNHQKHWISVALVVAIVIVINLIALNTQGRFDLTKNQVYTMTDVTKNTLDMIGEPVTVKVYHSEKFPRQLITTKQYVFDLLEEYKSYAGSALEYDFIEIGEADADAKQEANSYGVQPVQANITENDQMKVQLIYFGIVFLLGDQKEVIPFPGKIDQLEYIFTGAIKKLTGGGKTKIAYFTGQDEPSLTGPNQFDPNPQRSQPKLRRMLAMLSDQYDVEPVDLTKVNQIPETYQTALWVAPTSKISEKARLMVDQFLMRGGNIALLADQFKVDLQNQMIPILPVNTGLPELLRNYGINLRSDLLIDKQNGQIQMMRTIGGRFRMPVNVKYPFMPIVNSFNEDMNIVNRLNSVSLFFATTVDTLPGSRLQYQPLLYSSDQSGYAMKDPRRNMYNPNPQQFFNYSEKQLPVGLMARGTFTSAFRTKPDSIAFGGQFRTQGSSEAKLVVFGDADFVKDDFASNPDNLNMLLNTLDWLVDENGLISIRNKNIEVNSLDDEIMAEDAAGTREFLKILNVFLAPILVIAFGVIRWLIRRKSKQLAAVANTGA